ncbi:TetR/AcrR family transcriptional regulator [Brevundimonas sp. BT-123]|uniref:TetR/AcrR family transcriptional regulator n=1 Tax=Brevundimonas sp. BT-123 TaxID=2986928 RepID=UPI002235C4DA|nr:TetR/AcrR family transcriptional regulator [Brevundimonas sp. BT-123]MCW0045609.1 TetR/AcrR family transcriptional regulator [Brevundimonas sp. BT-123]
MSRPTPKPVRKDAVQNRAALLQAARIVLSEQGLDAPLDLIAEKAGVGRGTLYRHFADRTELALAVLEADVADLGRRTAEQGDDPAAFFWFLDRLAEDMIRNAGLAGLVRNVRSPDALTPLRQSLMEAGAASLKRAQAAGLVREDLRPMDIRLIATLLGAGFQGAGKAERQVVSQRTRAILLDGLRPRPEAR